MSRGLATASVALLTLFGSTTATAGNETIAVVASAEEGPLPQSTLDSVLWHALHSEHNHRALFLDALDADAVRTMRGSTMTTLLHVELSWKPDSARVNQPDDQVYLVGGHYPVIRTTEYALQGDSLVAKTTWQTEGPLSVFHVRGDDADRFISLPEVSLQETATLAVGPIQAPVWSAASDLVSVPIVLAADDEYRAFYGEAEWPKVASRAVSRANAILEDVGITLHIAGTQGWDSPSEATDLSDILGSMSQQPIPHPIALRVGFTGQTSLAVAWQAEMEDVGRAYLPGRDVLVADQAVTPGHDAAWDVAEEGVTVAHEVLHALGVPHSETPDQLMSATKRGSVHAVSESTIDLGRVAASSRYTQWNTLTALTALSHAAEDHLTDLELKFDYISDNLHYGVGIPDPSAIEPGELSALTNVAVGRYFLARAAEDPSNATELRKTAGEHADSALASQPSWHQARQLQRQVLAAQRAAKPTTQANSPDPVPEFAPTGFGDRPTCPADGSGTCE